MPPLWDPHPGSTSLLSSAGVVGLLIAAAVFPAIYAACWLGVTIARVLG